MNIISVKNLTKNFRISEKKKGIFSFLFNRKTLIKSALDHLSFDICEGELVGYIGPNGAGKSTTVKILAGILHPNEGEVKVLGKTPWENRIETVSQIGVVFGQRTQLLWDLPVIDSFQFLKEIYRIPQGSYQRALEELTEALDLAKLYSIPVRHLSLGQRMRCDIAASLLHSPKILFLDEPTIGLDAVSKIAVRNFIRNLNQQHKTTIILTTHDMDDIESLCRRVLILNEGKLYYDGLLETFRQKMAPERRLIVDLIDDKAFVSDPEAVLLKQEGHRAWLKYNPQKTSTTTLISRITSNYPIRDLYIENPPIEEIIAQLYREVNL